MLFNPWLHPQSTYIVQSTVWRLPNSWPPRAPTPLSTQRVFPSPAPKAGRGWGGTHSPGGEWVGGEIFRKTPDIGLASYSIIPLQLHPSPTPHPHEHQLWNVERERQTDHTGSLGHMRLVQNLIMVLASTNQQLTTTLHTVYTDTKKQANRHQQKILGMSRTMYIIVITHIQKPCIFLKNSVSCNRLIPALFPPT